MEWLMFDLTHDIDQIVQSANCVLYGKKEKRCLVIMAKQIDFQNLRGINKISFVLFYNLYLLSIITELKPTFRFTSCNYRK